ncbi:hypothetical protein RND81_04G192400 [Saponaria officinalis]|uniref:Exportin-4 n=1 Tax=Saponaria officinalis TaxID=3572 RepID=A0AAW1LPN1_SAPOF
MQPIELNDFVRCQSIMHTIELACSSIQMHVNPSAAEATILSLSQSPQPYQACKFILENSQVANARFQAAAAIRNAAIREWGILTLEDKRGLISFCLCFVMQHASSPEGYVQSKVSSVAAQLLKRGWLEFQADEKEAFLFQIKQAIAGNHGADVQFTGINFLESLVSEFSPSTSTAMGLPREFHEQCRRSMELDHLKTFYSWAQQAAFSVTDRIVESSSEVPEVKVCTATLRLMLQILNWDFRYSSGDAVKKNIDVFAAGAKPDAAYSRRSECLLVQPGPSWQELLLSSGHVSWVLNIYGALRLKFPLKGYWIDCPIAVSARKLIVQFCSLTGSIFPADNEHMQEHHLVQLLTGVIQWVHPPDAVAREIECGKSESEMLDGCRALMAIATVGSPFVFDKLLKSICPFGTVTLLSSLMSEVVKVLMATKTDEETWSWVARDILLDTWAALLAPIESSSRNPPLPPESISAAANLFALIVESELKAASASAFDDDDDGNDYLQASIFGMDERLSSYGLIARASIEYSIPFLTKLFMERFAQLHQMRSISDPTAILEEVYSLLLITGHVLAEEGEGELPLVPEAIQMHFAGCTEGDKHPVVVLSSSILQFADQSGDPEIRATIFSPRLMEAFIWFIARWSRTYLMPPESNGTSVGSYLPEQLQHSRKALFDYFGEHSQGKFVLNIIVRVSMTALISYPGEKDLQELTCRHLLHGLVRRRDICSQLVSLDSWRDLANSFANGKTLFSLGTPHQRSLARTLAISASGLRNSDASNQYVRDLLHHMTAYLVDLSGKHDLKKVSQQPETILVVTCVLDRLRGAASASDPRTQKAIYEMGCSVMKPILSLLEIYKDESAVVYLLLKFVVQWVDGQIIYLEAHETAVLIDFCMSLLRMYSFHNIGKITLSRSSALVNEAKTEKYKDLRALVQLLTNLCSKDLVDFSTESVESQSISIGQVVFFGLHIITPLISFDLLKFPKLCRDYFSLISHMLEVYPEMVAQLNTEAFVHVLGTLDYGLRHQDSEVVDMCLRALKALASYHYKETISGKVGLGSHAGGFTDSDGKFQEGILSRFLPSLLQLLLFEDYSTELVSSAADAVLPLILCEQNLYQQLCNELIEKQTDPTLKTRLANALHTLTSANQLSTALDRINYQRFRKNLLNFLVEVRGFLRTV